ncbi:MAG: 2-hydroxyacyl-CoA dehydratase family protein, partial [Chloroflexota bacterium]
MANKVTAPAKKSLQTSAEVGRFVKGHYARMRADKEQGRPVVWTFGVMPRELWVALDLAVGALEHLPIMAASKQVIGQYLDLAEELGFGRDLCPYHTTMIGCSAAPVRDEYMERILTPPDLIVASNYPCMAESKSFLFAVERFGCPYYFIDAPINTWGARVDDHAVHYYVEQVIGLLAFLGDHGLKMDMARLSRVVADSKTMTHLWSEVDEYRKLSPVPMSFADGLTCMYLMVYYPGHPEAVEVYRRLRDEVRYRAENKMGVLDDERFRLLFLGVPPFYNMGLLNYPEKYGGVFVKSEMEYIGTGQMNLDVLDPEHPLQSLARKQLADWPNPTYANRIELMRRVVKEFRIDGIVAAHKRGCRNLPAGFRLIKDAVAGEAGIPMTVFDLDGLDLREYNDAQVKSNLDSFMET